LVWGQGRSSAEERDPFHQGQELPPLSYGVAYANSGKWSVVHILPIGREGPCSLAILEEKISAVGNPGKLDALKLAPRTGHTGMAHMRIFVEANPRGWCSMYPPGSRNRRGLVILDPNACRGLHGALGPA
jgi:hypothetical protein